MPALRSRVVFALSWASLKPGLTWVPVLLCVCNIWVTECGGYVPFVSAAPDAP